MAATLTREARPSTIRTGFPPPFKRPGTVYAVAVELNVEQLRTRGPSPDDAEADVRRLLEEHGFTRRDGDFYFGGAEVNAVTCVLAAQDLARSLPWFAAAVRDIRVLRIEEQNDLMPLVQRIAGLAAGGT